VSAPPDGSGQAALVQRSREAFARVFGGEARTALAPGRVNLIGEHTDYNDGFVLPMALDLCAAVTFRPRGDRQLRLHAAAYAETVVLDLDALAPGGHKGWSSYVAGVAWAFAEAGHRLPGLDAVIDGNVPLGAGLSSSAALELASARAFAAVAGLPWDARDMAKLGQRAENQYVGVNCGLMDQMASAAAQAGAALLLDCRSLETEAVRVPAAAAIVVMDTGARRELATSAYNDRRRACEAAVEALRESRPEIRALRDVTEAELDAAAGHVDPVVLRRARHVVTENVRTLRMVEALRGGDLALAGRLMNESHQSLRDLYEVSSAELDLVTELARARPECHGARMTGAGFGGCAVALVGAAGASAFIGSVAAAYRERVDLASAFFAGKPAAGARLWD
jgi:galactokinase